MSNGNFIGLYFMWVLPLSSTLLVFEGKTNIVKFNIPTGSTVREHNFLASR
jgi:hypothetical protein